MQKYAAGGASVPIVRISAMTAHTPFAFLERALPKHLLDAKYHLQYFKADGTTDHLRDRYICSFGLSDLFSVGRNLRAFALFHGAAAPSDHSIINGLLEVLRRARGADDATRSKVRHEVITGLTELYFPTSRDHTAFVVPNLVLFRNGSGLLHFAASCRLSDLCLDLMMFFGCPAYSRNALGKSPMDYALESGYVTLAVVLEDAATLQLLHDATV